MLFKMNNGNLMFIAHISDVKIQQILYYIILYYINWCKYVNYLVSEIVMYFVADCVNVKTRNVDNVPEQVFTNSKVSVTHASFFSHLTLFCALQFLYKQKNTINDTKFLRVAFCNYKYSCAVKNVDNHYWVKRDFNKSLMR